ncbi:short-chain dehydrogenase [Vararia minispora EC-137]|uniref:Short-chain dehydrogenase n=1 Tax=Vararia minispora EC-137 TaxID=1314806 RepID=A0ACB8QVZ6_9AGAM|nr:short-chain dehydrogenase [Vararia minispora EC-137]
MGHFSFPRFVIDQWTTIPQLEPVDLSGQTVLVVGANAGLGLEAAKHFARMKPGKLALACRTKKKCEDTAKEIQEVIGYGTISCYAVELADFASVVAFAEEFEKAEGRLDILLYNAGVSTQKYERTTDGWEKNLQVNLLSCALLSILLLPLVLKTSYLTAVTAHRPRLVFVTSDTHYWVKSIPEISNTSNILEKLNDKDYCNVKSVMDSRYFVTKLLIVLFTRELAARLPPSKAIINTVNPGLCHSGILRDVSGGLPLKVFVQIMARTTEVGGRLIVWAAIADRHREEALHGKYISDMEIREESELAISKDGYAMQRKLWGDIVDVLAAVAPRFKEVVDAHLSN